MNVYLAALETTLPNNLISEQVLSTPVLILGSYYSICQRNPKRYCELIPNFKDFMLDSGAFSFMNSGSSNQEWNRYIEEYAEFIKKNNVEKFFELDIDVIVGYDQVKEYRYILERLVNKPSIPVWHKSRGYEEFLRLCEEYPYVAIGGIAIKNIRQDEYKYFTRMIREAHKRNSKIHGLGFTGSDNLKKYHFDSVDSSSWNTGVRYGNLYMFNGNRIVMQKRKADTRVGDMRGLNAHNFTEWVKFQKYAETHL